MSLRKRPRYVNSKLLTWVSPLSQGQRDPLPDRSGQLQAQTHPKLEDDGGGLGEWQDSVKFVFQIRDSEPNSSIGL